jgi:glycosyltransferase involved in cell wall biosynthesis
MRVVYLNPFSQEVSGPDESLRTLLAELVPLGIEAHVVLPAIGPQVVRYEQLGAVVHVAPLAPIRRDLSPATAAYPLRLVAAAARVRAIARRVRADLIHTNMEVLLEGALAARSLRIPHVMHYRGNTYDQPKWVFDGLTAVWSGTADHIYCISHATAAVFERRGRMRKVEVLYNPVDVARFSTAVRSADVRASLGARDRVRLVGTVGRLHPRKDLETFLRGAADVARRVSDTHFVIVGTAEVDVELDYERRLRALVKELALEHQVTFAGARRDMPAVLASFDAFVLTSRHEGFGRVVAEAMAAGRPMVVSDEGAPPELVEAERYGLVARPGDASDFGRQIERLLVDPGLAAGVGARAAERAVLFEARGTAIRVKERYGQLLGGPRRS